MLAILLTLFGLQLTPPPAIPKPQVPRHEIVRTYAESDSGVGVNSRQEQRAENSPVEDPRDVEEGRNPSVYPIPRDVGDGADRESQRFDSGNYTVSPDGGVTTLPETRDNRVFDEATDGVGQSERNRSATDDAVISGDNGAVEFDFTAKKTDLDGVYSRMFELKEEIAKQATELERDMEEYAALKRAYTKELYELIGKWVDSRSESVNG